MAILTAYDLGFIVSLPDAPAFREGLGMQMRMTFRAQPSDVDSTAFGAVATAWFMLASVGAMCGDSIQANLSSVEDWAALSMFRCSSQISFFERPENCNFPNLHN